MRKHNAKGQLICEGCNKVLAPDCYVVCNKTTEKVPGKRMVEEDIFCVECAEREWRCEQED